MRSKPRKKKDERLSCRKNLKSCLTAKTKVRMPRPFLRLSYASRSRFEAAPLTHFSRHVVISFGRKFFAGFRRLKHCQFFRVWSRSTFSPTHFWWDGRSRKKRRRRRGTVAARVCTLRARQ